MALLKFALNMAVLYIISFYHYIVYARITRQLRLQRVDQKTRTRDRIKTKRKRITCQIVIVMDPLERQTVDLFPSFLETSL